MNWRRPSMQRKHKWLEEVQSFSITYCEISGLSSLPVANSASKELLKIVLLKQKYCKKTAVILEFSESLGSLKPAVIREDVTRQQYFWLNHIRWDPRA